MKNWILLLFTLLLSTNFICAQTSTASNKEQNKHALIVAVWGNCRSIASVNYEKLFSVPKHPNLYFTTSIGFGLLPGDGKLGLKTIKSVPVLFSIVAGKNKHYAQFGVGYTGSFGKNVTDFASVPPTIYLKYESAYSINIGYRYMEYKGAMFTVNPVSLIRTNNPSSKFMYSFSFSIGGTF